MRNRTVNIIGAITVCVVAGLVRGDPGDHNKQGDVRRIGISIADLPWWVRRPGEPLSWYLARIRWATREVPRIQDHEVPGDPDDVPGDDGPGCPDC